MIRFIIRRILISIPVLFIIAAISFFMIKKAPGGPFSKEKAAPPDVIKKLEAQYGLDQPVYKQFGTYLKNVLVHGDLGPSYRYVNWTVNDLILSGFPVSLELGCWSLMVAMLLGIPAGIIASIKPNSWSDYFPMSFSMLGICLPTFVMGPLLVGVFALWLGWYNSSGWDFGYDRILPSLTLGGYYAAYLARLTRGGMLEVLNQDYIRTARAKGVSEFNVVAKHALKTGLLPVVSFLGPATAGLLTGSFVVETIFDIPGLGRYFVTSAFNRDYLLLMGSILFYAVLIVTMNLIVDVLQVWLNPKLRFD
jgi:oligopeptide transport system permease protein